MKVDPAKHILNHVQGVICIPVYVTLVYSKILHDMFNVVLVLTSFIVYTVDRDTKDSYNRFANFVLFKINSHIPN